MRRSKSRLGRRPTPSSLGDVSANAQLYYQLTNGGAATNFTYTDEANIGVKVYGDSTHGNFDTRTYLKGYCREYAKRYSESVLGDTGKTGTGAYIVNLLLANSDDLDIVNTDTDVIATPISPYNKMRLNYFATAYTKDVDDTSGSNPRNFGIVIDCGTHSGVDGEQLERHDHLHDNYGRHHRGQLHWRHPHADPYIRLLHRQNLHF